jgi:hypothetical protein
VELAPVEPHGDDARVGESAHPVVAEPVHDGDLDQVSLRPRRVARRVAGGDRRRHRTGERQITVVGEKPHVPVADL